MDHLQDSNGSANIAETKAIGVRPQIWPQSSGTNPTNKLSFRTIKRGLKNVRCRRRLMPLVGRKLCEEEKFKKQCFTMRGLLPNVLTVADIQTTKLPLMMSSRLNVIAANALDGAGRFALQTKQANGAITILPTI